MTIHALTVLPTHVEQQDRTPDGDILRQFAFGATHHTPTIFYQQFVLAAGLTRETVPVLSVVREDDDTQSVDEHEKAELHTWTSLLAALVAMHERCN